MTGGEGSPPTSPTAASTDTGAAGDLRRSVLRNTGAQVIGRGLVALGRLVVASVIVRGFGAGTFGEYALVFGLLSFAEWIADFGTGEVFVRDISRDAKGKAALLRILTALKLVQVPAAFCALAAVLLMMQYPGEIVRAGLVGGTSLVFMGGVLVYRVVFKAGLTIERDIAAELVSVLAMIPMVAIATRQGGGLEALFVCHVISRGIYFALCLVLGWRRFVPSVRGVTVRDMRAAGEASAAIGVIGVLIVIYEIVDVMLLSKLSTAEELATYSAAQRMVWPIMLALGSIGGTLYPVAARFWPATPARFADACQRGLDSVLVLAGVALSSTLAAAPFYLGLIGSALLPGVPALRVLSVLVFFKAISSTLGPVLYVVHAQRHTLLFISAAVIMKTAVIAVLASRFGALGVATGALVVELAFSVIPTVYLLRRHGGLRLRLGVPLKVAVAMALAAGAATLVSPDGGLASALVAPVIYFVLVFALGAVRSDDLRLLLRRGES